MKWIVPWVLAMACGFACAADIQIPAQPLVPALQTFGKLRDVLVIYVSDDLKDVQTPGVAGDLTNDEALKQLLVGTGLTYQYLDAQTVSILPAPTVARKPTPPPAEQAENQATITALREYDEAQLEAVLSEFVSSHGALTVRAGKVARWAQGICPITIGLSPTLNAYFSRRILQVAQQVGVPKQRNPRCKPNVELIVTHEPEQIIDFIAKRRRGMLLGFHYASQRERVKEFNRPVQAWYLTATRGGDSGEELIDHEFARVPAGRTGSRLSAPVISVFANVLIIADARQLLGRHIGPLSDYVAMLALSQSKSLDACDKLPSILDLMSPECSLRPQPTALSTGDVAYLKALYSADPSWPASIEKSHFSNRMKENIKEP